MIIFGGKNLACILLYIVILVSDWMIYKKMGRKGWEAIIPIYNFYVLCKEIYGNGWKFLLILIPFYNIYFYFKVNIDLSKKFNQDFGFGIGLALIPVMFKLMLAFGKYEYMDGSFANNQDDIVSDAVKKTKEFVDGINSNNANANTSKVSKNNENEANNANTENINNETDNSKPENTENKNINDLETLNTIEKLKEMKDNGIITEEEFANKKTELLGRI